MQSHELLKLLKDTGAMMDGHFLLTSGRHSNVYIEKFRILENPFSLNEICHSMAQAVINKKIDIVLGAAIGGILIAGGVGRHIDKKHIFSEFVPFHTYGCLSRPWDLFQDLRLQKLVSKLSIRGLGRP